MRILLVTETNFPASDATTTTVKALADGLIDRGHEVRFVAPAPGLGCYRGSAVARISPLAQPGAQVRAAVDAFRPDVVVATSPATTPGGLGRKALKHCRATGVRSVVLQQQPVPDLAWDYWRTRVAERADAVVVTARWMSAHLEALGVRTTTWLPGVDTDAFTPALRDEWLHRHWSRASAKDGPLVVVGFVGSLHKRHGVRRLAALAQVPGIRPVVVGEGPQREWLQSRLPGARFTGVLGSGDLAVALASTDVVVNPGEHETCSHVLREAGASGVPVVGPRAGGAREVVRHLETGLLHEPGDAHALARAVAAVAGDPRRALLGERGREVALERTWAVAVDELEALLRRTTGVVTAG